MAGTKEIKRRIKSVKNTKKITKAMELVAASKMKRAVSKTLASRLYASYSWELLTSLSSRLEEITHPFFVEREEGKTLIVLITSNRGLCGAYNSQVIKKTVAMLKTLVNEENQDVDFITIGKKGDVAIRRIGQNVIASFNELPDNIALSDVNSISRLLTSEYEVGYYKNIYVAYTDFVSALTQKPHIRKLLPVSKTELKEVIDNLNNEKSAEARLSRSRESLASATQYLFEGNVNELIKSLAEKFKVSSAVFL